MDKGVCVMSVPVLVTAPPSGPDLPRMAIE